MKNWQLSRVLITIGLLVFISACVRGRGEITSEEVLEHGIPTEYLTCERTGTLARPDTQMIGPNGGRLRSGNSEVTIPSRAVPDQRRFVFSVVPGDTVGVIIDAGGPMHFNNRSARLIIDTSHCSASDLENDEGWWVWRIVRRGESQKLSTIMTPVRAITQIDSTSVFMIAN
ncbi:MAG TPA: hypothetical protein VHG09_12230 [Longimicrobiales bacterium]|nr:hypothetical protein [Longimicrobiales bacterium]